jgi:hypothetical protein
LAVIVQVVAVGDAVVGHVPVIVPVPPENETLSEPPDPQVRVEVELLIVTAP